MLGTACARNAAVLLTFCVAYACGSEPVSSGGNDSEAILPFDRLFELERLVVLEDPRDDPIGRFEAMFLWQGMLGIIDGMQANLKLFDMDGRFRGAIGRIGDGPGELRDPVSAAGLPDGSLAVLDRREMGITFFNESGEFDERHRIYVSGGRSLLILDDGNRFAASGTLVQAGGPVTWHPVSGDGVHLFDRAGNHVKSLAEGVAQTHPLQRTFSGTLAAAVGDVIVSVQNFSNSVNHHDLVTGREWRTRAGGASYRAPRWPRDAFASLPEMNAWANEQMWTTRLVGVGDDMYIVGFATYEADTRTKTFRYSPRSADGAAIATTGETRHELVHSDGNRIYSIAVLDGGELEVGVFAVPGN